MRISALYPPLLAIIFGACSASSPAPVCVAGASLDGDGSCRSAQSPVHLLPFRAGTETKVMQGFHGYLSHKDDLSYSVDFRCEEGAAVTASRSGRVWAVREDSVSGCPDPSCVDEANYVVLDHGDGTYGEYYHLMPRGVLVEEGEMVCSGQAIGMCGNTGYSSGPHLHFALTDPTRRTLPMQFAEMRAATGWGFPVPEATYRSKNRLRSDCDDVAYSTLGRDAFAHHGIVITEPVPVVVDEERREAVLEGRYFGDHSHVAIHRKPMDGGPWLDECAPVGRDGRFRLPLRWEAERFAAGDYWFMVTGSDDACRSPGWAWSYRVRVGDVEKSGSQ